MLQCPSCGAEIRYLVGAPSSGYAGQPIAVDIAPKTLIGETGRLLIGYTVHKCPEMVSVEGKCD